MILDLNTKKIGFGYKFRLSTSCSICFALLLYKSVLFHNFGVLSFPLSRSALRKLAIHFRRVIVNNIRFPPNHRATPSSDTNIFTATYFWNENSTSLCLHCDEYLLEAKYIPDVNDQRFLPPYGSVSIKLIKFRRLNTYIF